jgi:hypothetical protein
VVLPNVTSSRYGLAPILNVSLGHNLPKRTAMWEPWLGKKMDHKVKKRTEHYHAGISIRKLRKITQIVSQFQPKTALSFLRAFSNRDEFGSATCRVLSRRLLTHG